MNNEDGDFSCNGNFNLNYHHSQDHMWLYSHCTAEYLISSLCISGLQVNLVELIVLKVKPCLMSSNFKAHFGHGHVAIDSIGETLLQVITCYHCTGCIWSPVYPIVLDSYWPYRTGLVFNPTGLKVTLLTRKTWWRNHFSCQ